MNKKIIYLPDTNILFNLAETIVNPSKLKPWHRGAQSFWKNHGRNTELPSIVLAEFCGLWFHKNVDLKNYNKWFENRLIVYALMYKKIKNDYGVKLCEESGISGKNIMNGAAAITSQQMPVALINFIKSRINRTIIGCQKSINADPYNSNAVKALARNEKMLVSGKILDGLDSLITVFAYEYAKTNKDKEIIVVSDDKFMVDTIQYFHNTNKTNKILSGYTIPANTSAILTKDLFSKRKSTKTTKFKRL